jgi:membrane fusion protein (multidrug efflux system)
LLGLGAAVVLAALAVYFGYTWWFYRQSHSITEDAFVEAHIVNVAPQTVSGHVVRFLVEENDRVKKGDILAELDKEPYEVQVALKKAALEVAKTNLVAAQAQVHGQLAQARANRYKLEHAIEMVDNQIANLHALVATHESRTSSMQLAEANLKRGEKLLPTAAISVQDVDVLRSTYTVAQANVEQSLQEIYASRAALGLPLTPPQGKKLDYVPPGLDQNFSSVRDALGALIQSAAQFGATPTSWTATPKETLEQFYKQDPEGNLNRIYERLIPLAPAIKQAQANVDQASRDLDQALLNLRYTCLRAPFPGVVVKRYLHLGDFASPGVAILSMYNPDLTYVTANLEEDRLPGVAPGNHVELQVDAFAEPLRGRVVWIEKSTGAQFALMPRNVVSGEFTKVVQRVPVRIQIEQDDRWPLLRAGLSVRAIIAHGQGDAQWAEQAAREMKDLESRYNEPQPPANGAGPGDHP